MVGNAAQLNLYSTYATGRPYSCIANDYSAAKLAYVSSSAKNAYESITGNSASLFTTYDVEVTVDKMWKNAKYSSYLWIDSNGTLMENPIEYENDKVEIIEYAVWPFVWKPLLEIEYDRNASYRAADCYQEMLLPALQEYDINLNP